MKDAFKSETKKIYGFIEEKCCVIWLGIVRIERMEWKMCLEMKPRKFTSLLKEETALLYDLKWWKYKLRDERCVWNWNQEN